MIESSGLSLIGPVREENQDTIHLPNGLEPESSGSLFAVADGMGGYANGGLASRLALQVLVENLNPRHGPRVSKQLSRGIQNANLSVYRTGERLGAGRIGTTLTAAYLAGDEVQLVHVGDSRAYLIRDGTARCLTEDHTAVGDLVRARLLPPEKVRTHVHRSILTRAVGLGLFVKADLSTHKIREGDCLILCSDGVWSVIQDDEIAALVARSQSVHEACQALVDLAFTRDTDDNLSVVAVWIRELPDSPIDKSPAHLPGWLRKGGIKPR